MREDWFARRTIVKDGRLTQYSELGICVFCNDKTCFLWLGCVLLLLLIIIIIIIHHGSFPPPGGWVGEA